MGEEDAVQLVVRTTVVTMKSRPTCCSASCPHLKHETTRKASCRLFREALAKPPFENARRCPDCVAQARQ